MSTQQVKLALHRIFGHKHPGDPRDVEVCGSWEEFAEHCLTHDPELQGVLTVPRLV